MDQNMFNQQRVHNFYNVKDILPNNASDKKVKNNVH